MIPNPSADTRPHRPFRPQHRADVLAPAVLLGGLAVGVAAVSTAALLSLVVPVEVLVGVPVGVGAAVGYAVLCDRWWLQALRVPTGAEL